MSDMSEANITAQYLQAILGELQAIRVELQQARSERDEARQRQQNYNRMLADWPQRSSDR